MTWHTRISYLETSDDLSDALLAQTTQSSLSLLGVLMWGEASGDDDTDWFNHPLYKCWYGYEVALAAYVTALSLQMSSRGFQSLECMVAADWVKDMRRESPSPLVLPPWHDDTDVLRSHRSNLTRRWPEEYSWKGTPELMPYVWPFVEEDGSYGLYVSKHDKQLLANGERALPKSVQDRIENL